MCYRTHTHTHTRSVWCVRCCCTLVEKPYVPVILAHGGAVYFIFNTEQYWFNIGYFTVFCCLLILLLILWFVTLTHFVFFLLLICLIYILLIRPCSVFCKMIGWKLLLNIVWKLRKCFLRVFHCFTHKTQECVFFFTFVIWNDLYLSVFIYLWYKYVFVFIYWLIYKTCAMVSVRCFTSSLLKSVCATVKYVIPHANFI